MMTGAFHFENLEVPTGASALTEGDSSIASGDRNGLFPEFDPERSGADEQDEPTFSAEELENAVEEARRTTAFEVEAATRANLINDLNHRQVQALEAIRENLGVSSKALEQSMRDTVDVAQGLAKMMGEAVVPKALQAQPLADIGEMLRQALCRLVEQPVLELRLESTLLKRVEGLLSPIVAETGFKGALTTVADPGLNAGDARLIWRNGVVERDLARIRDEADLLVDIWLREHSHEETSQTSDPTSEHAGSELSAPEGGLIHE